MVLITLFQFVSMWSISTKNEIIALLHLLFYFASTLTTQNEIKKIQNEKILHYFKTCCNTAGAFTKSVQHLCVCFFFFFFFFFFFVRFVFFLQSMLYNAALTHLRINLRTYGVSGRTQRQCNGIESLRSCYAARSPRRRSCSVTAT